MFQKLDDAHVVLRSQGVYRPAPLYAHNGFLYAKFGAGYVKMSKHGATSKAAVTWDDLYADFTIAYDTLGRATYTFPKE